MVSDNTIKNSTIGIVCIDQSHATITGNLVRDNGAGIKADDESAPVIEDNDVIYNDSCVLASNDADPDLGGGGNSSGDNEIHHPTDFFVVNLSGGVTVMADNNYWGNTVSPYQPKASKVIGSVDTSPAVGSPPAISPWAEEREEQNLPRVYALNQNFPNPFNPTTTLRYEVPNPGGNVDIAIYNVRGQLVRRLVQRPHAAGFYAAVWDGTDARGVEVSSGVYFVQMRAPSFVKSRKLVLLK
jgi:parallel beta-helix repeat protein